MSSPNIIFIFSDQHNPRITGHEGDPHARTPAIDRLAEEGTRLANCYCGAPLCVPSRMSMLTGLLPTHNGVFHNDQSLYSDIPTFVHSLTLAGYDTVLCGRMHFVGPDQRHGYTERLVGDLTAVRLGAPNPTFGKLEGTLGQSRRCVQRSGPGHSNVITYDETVVDAAESWLQQRSSDRPFFLTVGLYGPHCSYVCPRKLFDHYMDVLPLPDHPEGFLETVHPGVRSWFDRRNMVDVDQESVRRARAAYYGLVQLTDGYVGRILDALRQQKLLENSLVIYSSDHGDMAGHNGLFWKSNFYEGSVRVPFIASMPGVVTADRIIVEPTSLLDIGPTLIDTAGGEPLPGINGANLWPVLTGAATADPERAVFSMLGDLKSEAPSAMVRQGKWKLVSFHGYDAPQLFDLESDPEEQNDLGRKPGLEGIRRHLLAELGKHWDGYEVVKDVKITRQRAAWMRAWNQATEPPPGEEFWRGDAARNYIEDRD